MSAQVFPLLLTVAQRVLATAKIIILHMTYRFLFLSLTKNKIAKFTFAQSSLVNFSSLYPSALGTWLWQVSQQLLAEAVAWGHCSGMPLTRGTRPAHCAMGRSCQAQIILLSLVETDMSCKP